MGGALGTEQSIRRRLDNRVTLAALVRGPAQLPAPLRFTKHPRRRRARSFGPKDPGPNTEVSIRTTDHNHFVRRPFLIGEIVVAMIRDSFHGPGFAGAASTHRTRKISVDACIQQGTQDGFSLGNGD